MTWKCPNTGSEYDQETQDKIDSAGPGATVRVDCPYCGETHFFSPPLPWEIGDRGKVKETYTFKTVLVMESFLKDNEDA